MTGKLSRRGCMNTLAAALFEGLLTGLASGCAHPARLDEVWRRAEPASLADLDAWVWPNPDDHWRPVQAAEQGALERLIALLIRSAPHAVASHASSQPLRRRRATDLAAALAKAAGVELRQLELALETQTQPQTQPQTHRVDLWLVTEPPDDRRGRGTYVVRLGRVGPRDAPEILVQAPHSRFDRGTGALALRLLVEPSPPAPRAVFLNSAHRYRQLDGTRTRRSPPERNPADAAHNPDHPLACVTASLLAHRDLSVVQLHGFGRREPPRQIARDVQARPAAVHAPEPDLIVSAGAARPSPASAAIVERLRATVPEHRCAEFGIDHDRLGGQTNVQAQAARATGRCFIHLELSAPLRQALLEQPELRRRFAAAIFDPGARERGHGCR
jgi:hypothetical protein